MIVVVDGYNVLKNITPHEMVSLTQRKEFIAQLRAYAQKKGLLIVLVFDGGPSSWPTNDQYGAVCVVYAGAQKSADDYIKHYVTTHATKDLLLVSSDTELRTYGARYAVPSMKAHEFYAFMRQELQRQEHEAVVVHNKNVHKTTDEENSALDALMMAGSKKVPHKREEDDIDHERKGAGQTVSKDERALLKKLRKL